MSLRLIIPTDEEGKVTQPQITVITRVWLRLSGIVTIGFACDAISADPGENIHAEMLK